MWKGKTKKQKKTKENTSAHSWCMTPMMKLP